MLDINEMTFGVENEITIPRGVLTVGAYHRGAAIPGFPDGFTAQSDVSVRSDNAMRMGAEIVSPVLRGADGLLKLADVIAKLNAMGGSVNQRCGFHVHIGFPTGIIEKLGNLVYLTANLERAFYAATGTKNRERNNYCQPVKTSWARELNYDAVAAERSTVAATRGYQTTAGYVTPSVGARYHGLNLVPLLSGARPAVEFRFFQGTLNFQKIVGYIRMCLAVVQKASDMRRRVEWDAKGRGGIGGEADQPLNGKQELQRFFYRTGWNRGSTPKVYGMLEAPGVGGMDESKAILQRMATKYDLSA
jgi:hypothetical protein